jgi:hypothetical protein
MQLSEIKNSFANSLRAKPARFLARTAAGKHGEPTLLNLRETHFNGYSVYFMQFA